MIEPKEVNKAATINKVNDRQIEKDYVLSWVLFAISKNEILKKAHEGTKAQSLRDKILCDSSCLGDFVA